MIAKLRMFISHPLLAQNVILSALNYRVIGDLKQIAQNEDEAEPSAGKLASFILANSSPRPRPPGSFRELDNAFRRHVLDVSLNLGKFYGIELTACPHCRDIIEEGKPFVVTSCHHMYCKGCFDELPDQDGRIDTVTRVCRSCKVPIEQAGYSDCQARKRKQSTPKKAGKIGMPKRSRMTFKERLQLDKAAKDEWDEPSEEEADWISRIQDGMPSAKLTAIQDLVTNWIQEDKDVKIVIYAQYLNTIRLLQFLCDEKGWPYRLACHRYWTL
jgi:hypothetical protein